MGIVGAQHAAVQRLKPRGRLALWIVVVIAALASPLWLLLTGREPIADGRSLTTGWPVYAACLWSWLALTAMWALLASTPPNAITLPRNASAVIIYAGALWLAASRALVGDWLAGLAGALMVALVSIPFAAPLFDAAKGARFDFAERFASLSLWWFALGMWHPALWLMAHGAHFPIAALVNMGALLALFLVLQRNPHWFPRRTSTRIALWLAAFAWALTLALNPVEQR